MTTTLVRILTIIFAYLLASLVSGYVVYAALLIFPTGHGSQDAAAGGFSFGLFISLMVVYFAALPALLVIALAEWRRWTMWWYFSVAGSVIGALLGWTFSPPPWFPWLGLGFGPVAGLIYWAIAGRKTGFAERYNRFSIIVVLLLIAVVFIVSTWGAVFQAFF
jgi:hypothetical protein